MICWNCDSVMEPILSIELNVIGCAYCHELMALQVLDDGSPEYVKVSLCKLTRRRFAGISAGQLAMIGGLETIELNRGQAQLVNLWFQATAAGYRVGEGGELER